MEKYARQRQHMISNQLLPMGVNDESIMEAFGSISREIFVPKAHIDIAYADMPHTIAPNRWMYSPTVLGMLLQAGHFQPHYRVLVIGGGLGYTTALLSKLVKEVVYLEEDAQLSMAAKKAFCFLGDQHNIVMYQGPLHQGQPVHELYDRILLEGAAEEIPESLFEQLTDEGVLLGILAKSHAIGKALKIAKHGYKVTYLFETWCPVLPGFQKESDFEW